MEALKSFSVVHFVATKTVEAVPSKWILESRKFCKWPTDWEVATNSKQDKDSEPGEACPRYKIQLL